MATGRNRFVPERMSFELLFIELREPLNGLWFECFEALGIKKSKLLRIRDKYMKDPKICIIESLRLWLINTDPPPSWDSLVLVLRYTVMETDLADRIERLYVNPATADRPDLLSITSKKITYDDTKESLGPVEPSVFSHLTTEVMDILNDGPSCYALHYAITTLCCPDGSPYIDTKIINSSVTIDGIMMPLIFYNYITNYDIDMLVFLMRSLSLLDNIRIILDQYYSQRILGQPSVKKIRCTNTLFILKCTFEQNHPINPTFQNAVDLKESLSSICQLNDFPYIMQFIGWINNPVCFYYQLPQAVMQTVRSSLKTLPSSLKNIHIHQVHIEIGSGRFCISSNE